MFNANFWPTPPQVAAQMIELIDEKSGITVLEPSAGSGNLVIALKAAGYNVIACEEDQRLKRILEHECPVVADNFFTLTSSQVSHVKAIVMNPPFYGADRHIQHAWEIAPEGCKIIALCNSDTLQHDYSRSRKQLKVLVDDYGHSQDLGQCFKTAERSTEVEVSLIYVRKPSSNYDTEFEGFFMNEEPEEQGEGIMQYDAIRDIVNRYVAAVKLYDKQIELGEQMMELTDLFPEYRDARGNNEDLHYLTCKKSEAESYRATFKKGLQKRAWQFIFDKLDMRKHSTRGLKEDLNKFVEHQVNIPFTMRNIYRMLEIIVGTTSSRMDKALTEVFDSITKHHDENRYHVEGWKTNSHYLVNQKFILGYMCEKGWHGEIKFRFYNNGELLEDMAKALCYMTGKRYEDMDTLGGTIDMLKPDWGKWFDWGFFECRCYMKGSMHFKFKDIKVWEQFNVNIVRIRGLSLYEFKEQTKWQKKQNAA